MTAIGATRHRASAYMGRVLMATIACIPGCIERRALYPAPPVDVPSPPPAPMVEVRLAYGIGHRAVGWYRSRPGTPESAPAVLYLHGNGENLQTIHGSGLFDRMHRLGVHCLAIDYPGYGLSDGRPNEASLAAACDSALTWLDHRHPDSKIVLFGWSLGAAAAIGATVRNPSKTDALIAMSAWTTVTDVAARFYPRWLVRMLLRDRYNSLKAIQAVRCPVLLVHGTEDRLIPMEQGQALRDAATVRPRWVAVPSAGHNDLLDRALVWDEADRFMHSLGGDEPQ